MKVFILTEGGRKVGFGHITRCSALYEAFEEKCIRPYFIVNADNSVKTLLKGKRNKIFNWLKNQNGLSNLISGSDIVVVDSYLAKNDLYRKIAGRAKLAVYLDDNKRISYPKGIVVNGAVYAEGLKYPKTEETTYLLGIKYLPVRKELWRVLRKKIRKKIKTVMITFGGDDSKNMTPKVLKYLIPEYPNLKIKVMIGKGFYGDNLRKIKALKDSNTELIYYPSAEKMKEMMFKSDVAISAGGQTLYELARVGLPTVAIAVAENQLKNTKGWQETGFINYAGWWEEKKLISRLSKELGRLVSYRARLKRSKLGRSYIDGKGPKRIVDKIIDQVVDSREYKSCIHELKNIRLRKAAEDDCFDLLAWRNHPDIRKHSFGGEEVAYPEHRRWFSQKLHDKNTKIYIAEGKELGKIGQVRFDILTSRSARVNVNLNPAFLGRGFGNRIITMGTRYFLKDNPGIKMIIAEILDENTASKRAFQKAAYVFSRNILKNGRKTCVCKYGN